MSKKNIILTIVLLALVAMPMIIIPHADFGGADGGAMDEITNIAPDYEPWFESLWEPPSGEIESLLFAVQASLGTAFIAFFVGYTVGKRKHV